MKKEKQFSDLFYNAVTYVGVMVSVVVAALEVFLFAVDFLDKGKNLYLGLITYMILPGVLIFGLFLIPVGVLWKKSRIARGLPVIELKRFRIDLSLPHHRNAILVFIIGTSLLILMSVVGAYKAFHYTESVQFCGILCHEVMHPEYTAYLKSPHGRVKCVECHIGAGADWYVHSKLSGARQVVKILAHTFARPIVTPVKDLRPAEETCKQCHSPGKYFSAIDFRRSYFLTEAGNKRWNMRMLLNIGGGDRQSYGVHSHMNLDQEIYYAADDDKRQKISWIRSVDKRGHEMVFNSPDSKYKEKMPAAAKIRKMDCIDCHNRPTHQFFAPYRLINEGMQYGKIDPNLPEIKEKCMEALSKKYATKKGGAKIIHAGLIQFYRRRHPEIFSAKPIQLERSIRYLLEAYSQNIFPDMKVRWDTSPDNIGHLINPGCYRCHDGEHKAQDGKVITRNCTACHLIVEQGPAGAEEKNLDGLEFRHPPGGEEWKEMNCFDCHTGGA